MSVIGKKNFETDVPDESKQIFPAMSAKIECLGQSTDPGSPPKDNPPGGWSNTALECCTKPYISEPPGKS